MEEVKNKLFFREEIKNFKGLRPIPIDLNGKVLDWNMLARNEKQQLKRNLKKHAPKIWEKIELSKKIKIYEEPIKENIYYCGQCNKTHIAHLLDEGPTPLMIECHNCKWPEAASQGFNIPDSYKGKTPNIIFRHSTKEEYESAPVAVKDYLEQGGLYMEIVK